MSCFVFFGTQNNQAWLSAIICIRYAIVAKWAEQRGLAFTNYTNLSAQPEVYQAIRARSHHRFQYVALVFVSFAHATISYGIPWLAALEDLHGNKLTSREESAKGDHKLQKRQRSPTAEPGKSKRKVTTWLQMIRRSSLRDNGSWTVRRCRSHSIQRSDTG